MNSTVEHLGSAIGIAPGFYRGRIHQLLSQLQECDIELVERSNTEVRVIRDVPGTLRIRINVHDQSFYRRTVLGGSVGAAESFMDGEWDCDDLVSLVRALVRNRDLLDAMEKGPARIIGAIMRFAALLSRNTVAGSRRNIAAHYDLGNEFFKLFLDENLMYSSALFQSENETLEIASDRKLERICSRLQLSPTTTVIEIGTGWGGFALYAAKNHGCHVTTTTISREQFELATARVKTAGLSDKITVLCQDYRTLTGQFDRLVSIEMIEAIGHQYLGEYFDKVGSLLKRDGLALIQAITIEDYRYEIALRSVDFIKRYIFPGSFIPSISAMLNAAAKRSDLKLTKLETFGQSYALTLRKWRECFLRRADDVRTQGYSRQFVRMWEFYLAYCEGGFRERSTDVAHLILAKPSASLPP